MSDLKTSAGKWIWFCVQVIALCALLLTTVLLRRVMIEVHDDVFKGMPMPWVTRKMLYFGPIYLSSSVAFVLCAAATLLAIPILLRDTARKLYLAHAPVTILTLSISYIVFIFCSFILCFITIIEKLYTSDDSRPPGPIPDPVIPPWIWLVITIIYLAIVAVILKTKRANNASKRTESTRSA